MKKCVTCGNLRSEDEYYWRNKLLRRKWNTCKYCQADQRKRWYNKNKEEHKRITREQKQNNKQAAKEYVWDYLASQFCVDCGVGNPNVLEFDHVKGKKRKTLSYMTRHGFSISSINKEISKCEVRCANCHRLRTAKERGCFRG